MLFEPAGTLTYPDLDLVAHGYPDWRDPAQTGLVNTLRPAGGWRVLQGSGRVHGELYGGCLEVLDWLRGTSAWPPPEAWTGRLLFIETSELKPSPDQVASILRAFGVLGVFDGLAGLMLGRPRDRDDAEAAELEAAVLGVVAHEFGRADLPIAANLPFGHTDPQWVLPIGVKAELDVDARTLRLVEPWLA